MLIPDESNAFWTLLFDETNYVNDQDSGKSGFSLTDLKDEAEAFKLKNELNNIINEHFYGRAIKRKNPAAMIKGSKKIGLRVTKKDLDGSTIEDMTVGMGQKLADYQRILDRYLGRM